MNQTELTQLARDEGMAVVAREYDRQFHFDELNGLVFAVVLLVLLLEVLL